MIWTEKDAHYIESDKHYRITKGAEGALGRYTAWAPGATTEKPAIAAVPTVKEAMQVCEEHLTKSINQIRS